MTAPKYLYKYKPFGEFLLKELCEQEVHYCAPHLFNDPLDCKPLLSNDLDLKTLEKFAYQLLKRKNKDNGEWAIAQIRDFRYHATQFGKHDDGKEGERYYKSSLLKVIEADLQQAMGNIGVFSLSQEWNSMLMWSHYANNHKGVCLEFEFDDNRCTELHPVDYDTGLGISVEDLFQWRLRGDIEAGQRVRHSYLFKKSGDWKYEAEWRAIQSKPGSESESWSASSPFHLRSILFGARCESSVIITLVKLFSGSEIKPCFDQIYLDNQSATLRRDSADIGEIEAFGIRKSSIRRDEELSAEIDDLDELEEDISDLSPDTSGD